MQKCYITMTLVDYIVISTEEVIDGQLRVHTLHVNKDLVESLILGLKEVEGLLLEENLHNMPEASFAFYPIVPMRPKRGEKV